MKEVFATVADLEVTPDLLGGLQWATYEVAKEWGGKIAASDVLQGQLWSPTSLELIDGARLNKGSEYSAPELIVNKLVYATTHEMWQPLGGVFEFAGTAVRSLLRRSATEVTTEEPAEPDDRPADETIALEEVALQLGLSIGNGHEAILADVLESEQTARLKVAWLEPVIEPFAGLVRGPYASFATELEGLRSATLQPLRESYRRLGEASIRGLIEYVEDGKLRMDDDRIKMLAATGWVTGRAGLDDEALLETTLVDEVVNYRNTHDSSMRLEWLKWDYYCKHVRGEQPKAANLS